MQTTTSKAKRKTSREAAGRARGYRANGGKPGNDLLEEHDIARTGTAGGETKAKTRVRSRPGTKRSR
jgi:hypothetical protein